MLAVLLLGACAPSSPAGRPTDCRGVADGTPCDDADPCSETSVCAGGACVVDARRTCPEPDDPCLAAVCDPATGRCDERPAHEGRTCAAADPAACRPPGTCRAGTCTSSATAACPDVAACERRVWTGSGWEVARADEGTSCDDGRPCTRDTTCDADGVCGAGRPVRCTTDNPCARAFCDPEQGCVEDLVVDGTPCDDGDKCSLESACIAGVCSATELVECRGGPCVRSAACNPETGRCAIDAEPDGLPCDNGNVCTVDDRCQSGTCAPGDELPWEGEPCADGICFRDVTSTWGIDFVSRGPSVNDHGAPVALFDPDLDGDLDVLVGTETSPLRFYLNDGTGRFTEATEVAGLDVVEQGTQARLFTFAVADIDNDGDPDLYVGMQGTEDYLFENDGTGRFTDVTDASGLAGTRDANGADFGDFDEDGDLDLYIGHYIREPRFPVHSPEPNALYANRGDGTFEEVTSRYRVGGGDIGGTGTTLVVRWIDYDRDGDLDLFECNDFGANVGRSRLYENTGDSDPGSRFLNVAPSLGIDTDIYCMSITTGDWDRDTDLDLYFTNIGRHELYRNDAPAPFTEVARDAGAALQYDACEVNLLSAGWSALFVDFDHDGWLDLFSANGFIFAAEDFENSENVRNSVLHHQGPSLEFRDISRSAGASSQVLQSRGAAAGDLDGDGDLDLVVVNLYGPVEVFENVSVHDGGSVFVDVRGTVSNRDGYHAFVTAVFEDHEIGHEIDPHVGYQGVSQKSAHFGLGAAERIDEVRVEWPTSGIEQSRFDVESGTELLVLEARTTIDGAAAVGSLTAGAAGSIELLLERHVASAGSITVRIEDRTEDGAPVVVGSKSLDLPGGGSFARSLDVTPHAAGARRYVARVEGADGAIDEWAWSVAVSD